MFTMNMILKVIKLNFITEINCIDVDWKMETK
jgi:hypothetical protein